MLIIKNISRLWGVTSKNRLAGSEMSSLPYIDNAYIFIVGDKIEAYGPMSEFPVASCKEIDANGCEVMPSFCDSHTHLVYAASREDEFMARVKGLSYEQIAASGGGILNSADKLREMDEDALYAKALLRCKAIMQSGTGAVEIKSGYGLSVDSELKMLRVVARLKEALPMQVRATLLGAHAVGREFVDRQDDYVDMVCAKMIPAVAAEGLADFVDVFCDHGFFTVQQTEKILNAAAKYGMRPKIHANELAVSGGVQVGVKCGALSVDHLECMDDAAILALKGSDTMATALPGASFFLGIPFAPVRQMIDKGLSVAVASDFNPGSSPNGNMQFIMALAVIRAKMLPPEALAAATINGAYAMGVDDLCGSIEQGKLANLMILKQGSTLNLMTYYYGENHVETIILNGKKL